MCGLPRPTPAGQLRAMKLSHENQSKKGRTCSGVAVGGALAGIGTTLGMLPLMTTGGIDGNVPVAAVVVVDVVDVVDVDTEDVVASDELAGWYLTYVYDPVTDGSDLVIIDASDFEGDPVARIRLPRRVPHGFHGNWMPD